MKTIDARRLRGFAVALLAKGGFTAQEAEAIADSLILSDLMGHGSHGVMRIKPYLENLKNGHVASGAALRIERETASSVFADAQRGVGQVIVPRILETLYDKLATQAVVTAAVRNCGHMGRIGEWVEGAAKRGFPGLLLVNDNGALLHVAPPGGKKAVTSTNPIAFAIPLPGGEVFMTDMATSAIAFGKVTLAKLGKTEVAADCIQTAEGKPTTDPAALFTDPPGSILPMGGAQGYKGFAISMFVDMLVAGLSGGQTPPAPNAFKYSNSFTLTLWNPLFFAGLAHMQAEAQKYVEFLHSSPPTDAEKPIRIPGDRMNGTRREREKDGIPLNPGLVKGMLGLAQELGVTPPEELAG